MANSPVVFVPAFSLPAGRWAARSLSAGGLTVLAGEEEGREAVRMRTCAGLVTYPSPRHDEAGFLTAVDEICRTHSVAAVLPIDDEVVSLLAAELPRPGGAVVVGPSYRQYVELCDKSLLDAAAVRAGFVVPPSVVVGPDGPRGDWPALPNIVKPLSTGIRTASGMFSRKPIVVRSEEERVRAIAELVDVAGAALVQALLRTGGWRVHFVRGASRTDVLTLAVVRSYPRETGQSSVLESAEAPAGLTAAACRLLDDVDYRGPGSVQALEFGDGFFVHDVNLRLPITVAASIKGGLDMPLLAVSEALDLGVRSRARRRTVRYVSLPSEVRHLRDGVLRRGAEEPPPRVAAELALAALSPRRVLDPAVPTRFRALTRLIS